MVSQSVLCIVCLSWRSGRPWSITFQASTKNSHEERLVLLSRFDEVHLAKDVLARLWKNEPQRISPWKTLQQLIRVREIDPRLTKTQRALDG